MALIWNADIAISKEHTCEYPGCVYPADLALTLFGSRLLRHYYTSCFLWSLERDGAVGLAWR